MQRRRPSPQQRSSFSWLMFGWELSGKAPPLSGARVTKQLQKQFGCETPTGPDAPIQQTVRSFNLDAGVLDDLLPHADFLLDRRRELRGRAAGGCDAIVLQLDGGFLELQRLRRLGVEALDDVLGHAFRTDEAVPQHDVVPWNAGFSDARHVGQRRNAL